MHVNPVLLDSLTVIVTNIIIAFVFKPINSGHGPVDAMNASERFPSPTTVPLVPLLSNKKKREKRPETSGGVN